MTSLSFRDRIDSDLKNAMREKNELRVSVLRMLKASIMNAEISKGGKGSFDDAGVQDIVRKEAKKRQDSIHAFEEGGRAAMAEQEKKELEILKSYLPQMMTEQEVTALVNVVKQELAASGPADFGRVMKEVMKRSQGKAEGGAVSQAVKKALGS